MPKLTCGRCKDWLRQRNLWLTDIFWRLRRLLKPGMKYANLKEEQFPKVGKLQHPFIAYREMVKHRYTDYNNSRLERQRPCICVTPGIDANRWKKKCKDTC